MEKVKYSCIFKIGQPCPAKTAFKLKPESLVEFCKICVEKNKWDTLREAIEMVAKMQMKPMKSDVDPEKLRKECGVIGGIHDRINDVRLIVAKLETRVQKLETKILKPKYE